MEQKKDNMFSKLFLYSLIGKKNWFFLSTVIIFVTTLLIPYILGSDGEFFIVFGIFEVFALVFINCHIDNSFLHNDSKLAYYKSKPANFVEQISVNIIINLIFAAFLLGLMVLSVMFQGLDYRILESFKMIIPWLSAGIFLAALSSILSGNTLVAGVMTIFNFALPGIIFLIIQFMFSILENLVPGFSANVLMDMFIEKFYKLDYIYFAVYSEKSVNVVYFMLLASILTFISLLTLKMLKRRKNENTGNFIAFDGFKYFVSVLACLIVPALFSVISYNGNLTNEITVSLLMATLTYYIIIAVIEKSFRISKLSIKVFVVSMTVFIAATGVTILFANQYKNVVPDAEDVKMAYVGNNSYIYNEINNYVEIEDNTELSEFIKRNNVILFRDKENIETIIDLHREIISNQNYDYGDYYMYNMVIVYYMNDGSYLIRDYKINKGNENNEVKDEIASKLFNSREFKENRFYYLFDEEYYSNDDYDFNIRLRNNAKESDLSYSVDFNEIRPYLIKDINDEFSQTKDAFQRLGSYNYEMSYDYKEMGYYLDILVRDNNDSSKDLSDTIHIYDRSFENTKEYLNLD
ncbi:MAG: hypothetical protein AB7V48_07785 [Sedimentibacter sp.]